MRPAIEPLPAVLARGLVWVATTAIAVALVLHACACGAPFTLAPDAGELAMSSPGNDNDPLVMTMPPAADAGDEWIPERPTRDAGDESPEIGRAIVDAGDVLEDARELDAEGDAPVLEHGCSASTECPVCPGSPVMFACCHAGACGCVGLGEACSP